MYVVVTQYDHEMYGISRIFPDIKEAVERFNSINNGSKINHTIRSVLICELNLVDTDFLKMFPKNNLDTN